MGQARKENKMSQEKVNKYKEYKKNKKAILAQEKKKRRMEKIVAYTSVGVICAGLVGAIGVTIVNEYKAAVAARPTYKSESYIVSDMNQILEDETEAETEESVEESEKETTTEE